MSNKIIEAGKKTLAMFVPEDDGSASDWFENYSEELVKQTREEERERMASNFHRSWIEKFGYECIRWNKDEGEVITSHEIIKESITQPPEEVNKLN